MSSKPRPHGRSRFSTAMGFGATSRMDLLPCNSRSGTEILPPQHGGRYLEIPLGTATGPHPSVLQVYRRDVKGEKTVAIVSSRHGATLDESSKSLQGCLLLF